MKIGATLPLLAIVFSFGCVCPARKTFVDIPESPRKFDYHERVRAEGKKLIVELNQIPGRNIGRITPRFLEGDVYLEEMAISSGGHGVARFEVDLLRFALPPDWTNHVYWMLERSCPSLTMYLFQAGPHSEEIGRRKAKVE